MALEAGARLGPYEIVERLGSGGMGEVYRARDPRLEREVAIKVVPPEIMDARRLRRFEQEARATGTLDHPNVLAVHDIGTHEGAPYIVAELLDGQTLRVRLEDGPLPARKALDYALQIARGLAAAHDKGIVHRDLKPENVFVTGDGRIKILDFGLARLTPESPIEQKDDRATTKTESGAVMGTVGYMSPEQVLGQEPDGRSDSFGAVLYEMLSGSRAFRRPSAVETMNAILNEDPPELPATGPGLPSGLVRIAQRCLEKRAAERFHSAHDLALAIETISSEASRSLTAKDGGYDVALVVGIAKRHGKVLLAMLAAGVVLVAGGLYRALGRPAAPPAGEAITSVAVLPFENVGGDFDSEYLSDGVAESLINKLSRLPKLRVIARSTSFRFRGRDVEPRRVGRDLKVGAILTGRVSVRGDTLVIGAELVDVALGTQLWGEQYDTRMGDIIAVQEDIAGDIARRLRLKLTPEDETLLTPRRSENPEAYRLYLLSRYELGRATVEGYRKAVEYALQTEEDPGYPSAYVALAHASANHAAMGEIPYREGYSRSKAAATKALELDEKLPEAHTHLGVALTFLDWDWRGAEREHERALELNPNSAAAHDGYGFHRVLMRRRTQEGIEHMKRALALDPMSVVCRVGLFFAYYLDRQYDQALEQVKELSQFEDNPQFPGLRALVYREKGMYEEAIAEGRQFLGGRGCDGHLGNLYARAGRVREARDCLREIRQRMKQSGVGAYSMALVHAGLGEKDQAFEWLERAREVRDQGVVFLKVDPPLDPLRSDPRFQVLLRRMNFPS